VAVGGASLLDGVLEGAGNVLLSDDLGELLRTVFSGEDGVGHEPEVDYTGKLFHHRGKRGTSPDRLSLYQATFLRAGLRRNSARDRLVRQNCAESAASSNVAAVPGESYATETFEANCGRDPRDSMQRPDRVWR